MPPAYFFCAPALGLREILIVLIAFVVLVALPLWTYWRRKRMARDDRHSTDQHTGKSNHLER